MRRAPVAKKGPAPAVVPSPRQTPGRAPAPPRILAPPEIKVVSSSPRPSRTSAFKQMGGGGFGANRNYSGLPSKELIMQLTGSTAFTTEEISRLGRRFQKLDTDLSGTLSIDEFLQLPEVRQNPLGRRVVQTFDQDGNGNVDFREFVFGVSAFSMKGNSEARLRFAFKIYDIDNDGYISNGELFQILRMMSGDNLRETQLQEMVDKAYVYGDKDGDGKINFKEFQTMVLAGSANSVHKRMVIAGV